MNGMAAVLENRHVIQKTVFDISFDSEEVAFEQHLALDDLIKRRLMSVIEEEFDKAADAEHVLVLSSLEINLGVMSYAGYRQEIEERLRQRLRELLWEKKSLAKKSETYNNPILIGKSASDLSHLHYYLVNGYFSWNANTRGSHAFERFLTHVIDNNPAGFVRLLRESSQRATMLGRLVTQLPVRAFADILKIFVLPETVNQLFALVDDVHELCKVSPSIQKIFGKDLSKAIWTRLFHVVLENSDINPEELIDRVLIDLLSNMQLTDKAESLLLIDESMHAQGLISRPIFKRMLQNFVTAGENLKVHTPTALSSTSELIKKSETTRYIQYRAPFKTRNSYLNSLSINPAYFAKEKISRNTKSVLKRTTPPLFSEKTTRIWVELKPRKMQVVVTGFQKSIIKMLLILGMHCAKKYQAPRKIYFLFPR